MKLSFDLHTCTMAHITQACGGHNTNILILIKYFLFKKNINKRKYNFYPFALIRDLGKILIVYKVYFVNWSLWSSRGQPSQITHCTIWSHSLKIKEVSTRKCTKMLKHWFLLTKTNIDKSVGIIVGYWRDDGRWVGWHWTCCLTSWPPRAGMALFVKSQGS